MNITAAAPLNNHPVETHHLVTLRLSCVSVERVESVELKGETQPDAAMSSEPGYQ